MRFPLCIPAVALTCALWISPASARNYRVRLDPAEVDRSGQVIVFKLPADAPRTAALRDGQGHDVPMQADADGTVRFTVAAQKAGEALAFTLVAGSGEARAGVLVAPEAGDLRVNVGGQPMLFFRMDRNRLPRADIRPEVVRAGYLHPVFSPAGHIVTDDYPSNHVHHHGIWAPWTKTSFQGRAPDFWNMHQKSGAEDFVALDRTWSGPVHGGFEARLKMVDLSAPVPVTALNVGWRFIAYDVAGTARPVRMFDLVITQTCATNDPLFLPKYHYGGFGLRGAGAWNGPGEAARFLTSEGITDRIKGNDTRARWCYLGGVTEQGALAGTAALGHPDNFRSPQPIRLHPNMPYFSFVPQQLGDFRIEPGQPYTVQFRFIVADGAPDRTLLDAYWNGYAKPSAVKLDPL